MYMAESKGIVCESVFVCARVRASLLAYVRARVKEETFVCVCVRVCVRVCVSFCVCVCV